METSFLTFILGGGLATIIGIILQWRRFPIEKKSSMIDHSEKTVGMAMSTLTAINDRYQEVLDRQKELEKEVQDLKEQFHEQKTLVSKLKDYILFLFNNWESIRHEAQPPKLNTDIHTQIFKDKE